MAGPRPGHHGHDPPPPHGDAHHASRDDANPLAPLIAVVRAEAPTVGVLAVAVMMLFPLASLTCFHVRLIAIAQTTNEAVRGIYRLRKARAATKFRGSQPRPNSSTPSTMYQTKHGAS